ncbi:hypothetical protein NEOC65_000373 [Neochlamydia sp. AcF65]|nr:hypothetical protein [Neochlamydia sp. AcF65]
MFLIFIPLSYQLPTASDTGLSNLLDGQISHNKITHFLNNNQENQKNYGSMLKKKYAK